MIWYQARVLTENGTQLFKPVRSREQADAMTDKHRDNYMGDYASYTIIKMKQVVSEMEFDDDGRPNPNYHLITL